MPVYWRWLDDISFIGHGVKAAVINEMRGLTFNCDPSVDQLCYPTGEDVLRSLNMENVDVKMMMVRLGCAVNTMLLLLFAAARF